MSFVRRININSTNRKDEGLVNSPALRHSHTVLHADHLIFDPTVIDDVEARFQPAGLDDAAHGDHPLRYRYAERRVR